MALCRDSDDSAGSPLRKCQCLLSKMILLDSELNREEVTFAAKNVIKKGDLRRDLSRMYPANKARHWQPGRSARSESLGK
jgi:hypothetical protein